MRTIALIVVGTVAAIANGAKAAPNSATQPASASTLPSAVLNIGPSTAPSTAPSTRPAVASASTTAPSTRPAIAQTPSTAPSTRPANLLADAFIPRLGSEDWKIRQAAQDELIRMGEDARPVIRDLLDRPITDSEVRARLDGALAQIDENRVTGTSYITLHYKDAPASAIYADLSRQCYAKLKTMPDNLLDEPDLAKISIDVDRQPFWKVITQLSEKTGLDLQQYNEGVRLMRGGFRMNSPFTVLQGPFLVVATQISRTQVEMLAGGGSSNDFALQLVAYSEPKLKVLNSDAGVHLIEAVDDHGNSLIPTDNAQRGYYGGGGNTWNLFAQLKYPEKNPGAHVTRLKGSASFQVQTKSQVLEIPAVKSLRESSRMMGDMPVMFHDLKKAGTNWELRLSANPQAMGGDRWNQFNQNVQSIKLVDDAGQELDHAGMRSSGNGQGIEYVMMYVQSTQDGRHAGDPAKMLWEVPTGSRQVNVTFDFKNLPMPH